MLLSKPCKFLQQDQKCLRNGSYCDPLCTKIAYWDPDDPDNPGGETLIQRQQGIIWVEKRVEALGNCASVFAESLPEKISSDRTQSSRRFKERRKHPRLQVELPLEFRDEGDLPHGAVVCNISEGGILIQSIQDMPVGRELKVGVFFADEYELDQLKGTARVVWKICHFDTDWEGYKYALEFVGISIENRRKHVRLINNHLSVDDVSERFKNT